MSIPTVERPFKLRRALNRIEHWRRNTLLELQRLNADPQALLLLGQVADQLRRTAFQTSVLSGHVEKTP